jgi:hypothetical protein
MATTVTQIIAKIKEQAGTELGAEWTELPHVLDLTKNDNRRGKQGYGVRPLSASEAGGITNTYTLDHGFELVLMASVPKHDDDSQTFDVIGTLYDKQDELLKRMIRTKLGLPGVVLLVSAPNLAEPEFINDRQFVALRQTFNVRYRQAI